MRNARTQPQSPRWTLVTVLAAATLGACGPDLPRGWEDALYAGGEQSECAGNPYEAHDERIEVTPVADGVVVDYREAHFRCEQDVEAWVLEGATTLDILVQPTDMDPTVVPDCDCLYNIEMNFVRDPGEHTVTLYRRWDNLNTSNDPVRIGRAVVEVAGP